MIDVKRAWRPSPKLSLAAWADAQFVLSAENSAEAGRWKCIPYQRGILDALTDSTVTYVTFMKSARVGATKMMCVAIAYHIAQDPAAMMFVQPTIEAAAQFSKEEVAVMLRDVPVLAGIVSDDKADSESTIAHKMFSGGSLSLVGANSGNGFRRVSRRVIFLDEVDAYPVSAGHDGDPVKLAIKRSEMFWNRKVFAASTPLVAGRSRIEQLFSEGDQRRYYVPCPQCSHMDFLVFSPRSDGKGHYMAWDEGRPETAHFVCSANGCVIEHKDKRQMIERGEWRAAAPFSDHASFHISALYSYSPNSSWADIATEFLSVKDWPEQLRMFVNTVLGETYREKGDAPDWERLYNRREPRAPGVVPEGVKFLTAGVDVQKDRFVYEVVGWSFGKESWSIDAGVIPADTSNEREWLRLDELLARVYSSATTPFNVSLMAVDSGYNTQMAYNWCRRYPMNRVIAVKGATGARAIIGSPSQVDVTVSGRRIGYKVWPIGVDLAKGELYGWLRLPMPEPGQEAPGGYCHFPEYDASYFKQLTSEQLVTIVNQRTGFAKPEWQLIPGRENHFLDARVYARAAATLAGLDRLVKPAPALPSARPPPPSSGPAPKRTGTWLSSDSRFDRGKGWIR